jgi:predicted O-methyltransferase YrrM
MSFTATTTYGRYQYPAHFTYPEGLDIFFLNHEQFWKQIIQIHLKDTVKKALEIGSLHGAGAVWLREKYIGEDGEMHCIDINKSEHLANNIAPYSNVVFHQGASSDVLLDLNRQYTKPVFDLVFIDGSHIAKHVMEDAILSWRLLKFGGLMIFDDYNWGPTEAVENQPKTGIDAFLSGYRGHYQVVGHGWQIYVVKTKADIDAGVLQSNYAESNPHFNKDKY